MPEPPSDYEYRFSGIARLYGQKGLDALRASHVCIVGIGGVGSWVAEAIARSGIGEITLIDLDDICTSNVNRQLHALDGEIGRPKVEAMADRILRINPEVVVHTQHIFYNEKNAEELLSPGYDFVVDAIDALSKKCHLIVACKQRDTPLVVIGSAGGRIDPTRIQTADLSRSFHDPLLQKVRKRLRQRHRFPRNEKKKFKIDCVFSPEEMVFPQPDGTVCGDRVPEANLKLDCSSGYGTASFVTGAFGFAAAGIVVKRLAEHAQAD
jgi:tRNA A37 threonylcarbamoyladenosine dehydratase